MTPSPLPDNQTPPMPMQPENTGYLASGNTGNPVLDEISAAHANLSPQAQQAIEGAHGMLGISPSHSDPALAASTAPSPELAVPGVSGPRGPLPNLSPEIPVTANPMPPSGGTPMADGGEVASTALDNSNVTANADRRAFPGGGTNGTPLDRPMVPVPSAAQHEQSRITAPPLPGSDPNAHTSRDTGRPGIEQIHNPWLRGLATAGDVVASGLFPNFGRFVPGTTAHHDLLVDNADSAVNHEQASAKNASDVAHTGSETGLENAQAAAVPSESELHKSQADEAAARAENIRNPQKALSPKDKYIPVGDGVFNAESGDWAKEPTDKKLAEVTEIAPEKGKALGLTPNKDGKYLVPNAALGELLKAPPAKTVSPEQQFLDEFKAKNPNSTIADAEKAFKQLVPKEGPDHGASFVDPQTHKLVRVEPGQAVPEGAMSPTQTGAQNAPTIQQRNVAAQAGLVHEQTPMMLSEIDRMKDKLGPVAGRWNEFMQGKVGTDDPDMAGLRADLLMYSSAVALMHARGRLPENLREEFDHAINAPKQTAGNLTAVIKKIDQWATKNPGVAAHVGSGVQGPSSGGDVTLDQINAEVARRKATQGKK